MICKSDMSGWVGSGLEAADLSPLGLGLLTLVASLLWSGLTAVLRIAQEREENGLHDVKMSKRTLC